MEHEIIERDEGWEFVEKGITKLKRTIEGLPESPFNQEEWMALYTKIFNMSMQKRSHDHSKRLYVKYRETLEEYLTSTVLPSLKDKKDELLLRELVRRWLNHKVMVRRLSHIFEFLDRSFIPRRFLPTLNEVGIDCFRNLIYKEIKTDAMNAVFTLMNKEREEEQIDKELLKNVIDIFAEIGVGFMGLFEQFPGLYELDFEAQLLESSRAYYSCKASTWIADDLCSTYMLKVEECLKNERDRVSHYLTNSSEQKLIEVLANAKRWLFEPLFVHDALKVVFEEVWKNTVAGSSNAEVLPEFCDVEKSESEKSGDEAIETLEEAMELLPYNSDEEVSADHCRLSSAVTENGKGCSSAKSGASEDDEKIATRRTCNNWRKTTAKCM